jgi:hypothetical protein
MSNLEKLQAAGLVPKPHKLTPDDVKTIDSLTSDEVEGLIKIKRKLGDDFCRRNLSPSANIFI